MLKSLAWWYPDVSLSPDGRYIAYDSPEGHIALLAVDGGQEAVIGQKDAEDISARWTPDGSRIVFLSDRTGTTSLWSMPAEGGRAKGPAELLKANVGSMNPMGIVKNGTLYYSSQDDRRNISIAELDTAMKVTKPPVLGSERFVNTNGRGAWSRDGRYLAYYSFRKPGAGAPGHAGDSDRRHRRGAGHPFANPDSCTQLCRAAEVVSRWPLRVGRRLSTAAARLGILPVGFGQRQSSGLQHTMKWGIPAMQPDLSPDGKTIFYAHSDAGPTKLMRFDIDSRRETELLQAGGPDSLVSITVSPDGKQLAYLRKGSIEILPATGGEPRALYRAPGVTAGQSTVTWMPDQKNLLFVQSTGIGARDTHVLWRIPLDGSRPEQVGMSRTGDYPFAPQVHPDGHRFAFESHAFESHEAGGIEIWALENFLPQAATGN